MTLGSSACDNDCDFFERCDGDVREVCGEGPDQQIGREIHRFPCESPNPTCAVIDDKHVVCAAEPLTRCDESYTRTCEGDVLTACQGMTLSDRSVAGYVVRTDCADSDKVCGGDPALCL